MERALTKFKSGRGRIAIVMMVCLAAVLALPVMAHAASYQSEYPVGLVHGAPGFVSVDVMTTLKVKSATIAVTGVTSTGSSVATVINNGNTTGGIWTYSEVLGDNGLYHGHWAYASGGAAVASLYRTLPVLAPGTYNVTAHAVDNNDATIGTDDTWSFVIASQPATIVPVVPVLTNNCTVCHFAGNALISASGFAVDYSTDPAMGPDCLTCHVGGFTPKHLAVGNYFNSRGMESGATSVNATSVPASVHVNVDWTGSSACASCHGKTFYGVATKNPNYTYTVPNVGGTTEHAGCSCHSYGDVDANKACGKCHTGVYGDIHGWKPEGGSANPYQVPGTFTLGGHNTTTYGKVGAIADFSPAGTVVLNSKGTTITQNWELPESGVFWSQSKALNNDGTVNTAGVYSLNPTDSPAVAMDPAIRGGAGASAINKTVGWDSVITCNDCHTGLTAAGPQGSAQINVGLDPNFPDDWTRAEITSFDPTGMRSIETTRGPQSEYGKINTPYNPFYGMYGGNVNMGTFAIGQKANVTDAATTTILPGGFYNMGTPSSNGYSASSGPAKRFICTKCHKLTNSYQGLGIEGNGRGFRDNNANYMGFSNEAHMEHHADMVTGQGNCVSCHIAIPHGWKRPRLLVYESDPAPYKVQWVFSGYQAKGNAATALSVNGQNTDLGATIAAWSPAPGVSPTQTLQGNWGWGGYGSGTTSNPYSVIGAAIPPQSLGTTITTNYTKSTLTGAWMNPDGSDGPAPLGAYPDASINATVWAITNGLDSGTNGTMVTNTGKTFSSHLEKLSAINGAEKMLAAGPAETFYTNPNGTSWSKWAHDASGVGPGHFVAEGVAWIPNAGVDSSALYPDEAIQNNCTACTSAGLTHSDTGGTSEGVADNPVPGRKAYDGVSTQFHNGNTNHSSANNTAAWSEVPYWK